MAKSIDEFEEQLESNKTKAWFVYMESSDKTQEVQQIVYANTPQEAWETVFDEVTAKKTETGKRWRVVTINRM